MGLYIELLKVTAGSDGCTLTAENGNSIFLPYINSTLGYGQYWYDHGCFENDAYGIGFNPIASDTNLLLVRPVYDPSEI